MANHATVLTALADPTRRAIYERVAHTPCAVGEIAQELPVSRPAVSQHLKVLKDARLVRDRPEGTRRVYSIDPAGLALVRDYFELFWQRSLEAFAATAKSTSARPAGPAPGPAPGSAPQPPKEKS